MVMEFILLGFLAVFIGFIVLFGEKIEWESA